MKQYTKLSNRYGGLNRMPILSPDAIISMIDNAPNAPTDNVPGNDNAPMDNAPKDAPGNDNAQNAPTDNAPKDAPGNALKVFFKSLYNWLQRFFNHLPLLLFISFSSVLYAQNLSDKSDYINPNWINIDGKFYKYAFDQNRSINGSEDNISSKGITDIFSVINNIMSLAGLNDSSIELSKVRSKILNVKYVKRSLKEYKAICKQCDEGKLDRLGCDFYKSQLLYLDQIETLYQLQINAKRYKPP